MLISLAGIVALLFLRVRCNISYRTVWIRSTATIGSVFSLNPLIKPWLLYWPTALNADREENMQNRLLENNTMQKKEFKGIVHSKMKMYPTLSCSKPVWMSFFCWTQIRYFEEYTVPGHHLFPYCLVTYILQNLSLCVQPKWEIHTGLEQLEGV